MYTPKITPTKRPLFPLFVLFLATLFALFPNTASAQDDPSGRVARLNFMQGSVSFQPAGTQDWIDASPNRPLTTGDNLWADQNARGELHVGSAAVRLSGQTGISFLNLDDNVTQLQLAQGSLYVHMRQLADNEAFEVDTPNLAFTILRPGDYRITVDPNGGSSVIDIRAGSGEVTGGGQSFNLNPGQRYAFYGDDQLNIQPQRLPGRDDFDNWSISRDQHEEQSISARYVSRDVIGYDDLDSYGTWSQNSDYGPVWIPRGVSADWAPYHNGHWVFINPWGWTWVEDEPWGFAPFHYGRWAVIGNTWGWVPGPVAVVSVGFGRPAIVRPVYAPALVAFVGGGGFSVSLSFGGGPGVAWFPLGPRDVWVPGYRCSPAYVQNVNIRNTRVVNVTQVTNVYNNVYINRNTTVINNYTYANNVRAVTAVSRTTFVNGQPTGRASIRFTQDQIRRPQVAVNTPVQPVRQSVFGNQGASRYVPPATLANRAIVTRRAPAPQVVPLGHTQSFANSNGGFRPGANGTQGFNGHGAMPNPNNPNANPNNGPNRNPNGGFGGPGNNAPNNNTVTNPGNNGYRRPGIQEPANNGAAPNANTPGNNKANPDGRPGFQPFNRDNRNPDANSNPNNNQNPNQNNNRNQNQNPNGGDRGNFGRSGNGNNNPNPPANVNPNPPPAAATPAPVVQPPANNTTVNPNANPNGNGSPNARPGFQPFNRDNRNPNANQNQNQNQNQNNAPESNQNRGNFGRPGNGNNNANPPANVNPNPPPAAATPAPAVQQPANNTRVNPNTNPNVNGNGNANDNSNRNARGGFQQRRGNVNPNADAPNTVNPTAHPAPQAPPPPVAQAPPPQVQQKPAAQTPPPEKPANQGQAKDQTKEQRDAERKAHQGDHQ